MESNLRSNLPIQPGNVATFSTKLDFFQDGRGTARHGRHATFRHGTARDDLARHETAMRLTFFPLCSAFQKNALFVNMFIFCRASQTKATLLQTCSPFAAPFKKSHVFLYLFPFGCALKKRGAFLIMCLFFSTRTHCWQTCSCSCALKDNF